ncbi:MAG: hypothetical protein WC708_08560 [Lentisphaeria bacterium]
MKNLTPFLCLLALTMTGCVYYPARYSRPEHTGKLIFTGDPDDGFDYHAKCMPVTHALIYVHFYKYKQFNAWFSVGPSSLPLKQFRFYTFSDDDGRFRIPPISFWYIKSRSLLGTATGTGISRLETDLVSDNPHVTVADPNTTEHGINFTYRTWDDSEVRKWMDLPALPLNPGDQSQWDAVKEQLKNR